ncbi:hypothetical protein GLOTRDRAFT_132529 [Gloeophyllum trabeum ATCC 11539]|uniref:Uncharacterized protein n=1 Tax=Gloeophyllum trabeum (strain ATCC 11539 / FP-39264 / Madison 617) TaxID=670483 RepID=S7RGL9_GLOTA|nr:uncharacterized protein GLOTRDRAFT_132529 [Gloeophyllum trabeum ATCC 11539]EPQ51709.1 hypothetical protein GLOTRDRAFT_132529 [Gloeophyllum trabeum ATCC 11539]
MALQRALPVVDVLLVFYELDMRKSDGEVPRCASSIHGRHALLGELLRRRSGGRR